MRRSTTTVAWAVLACACARGDAERYELDGLVVVEDFDEPICAGTFAYFERRLSALERATGLPRDPLGLIFHWIYEPDEIPSQCGELAGACTKGRDLHGQLWSFSHELVHAHLDRLGTPRVWLTEGMATMLAEDLRGEPDPEVTPSDLLRIDDARGLNYTAAAGFTVYLRDRYGMPQLLDYYAATAGADADSSVATFRDVFGDDFSAAEADYLATGLSVSIGSPDCDVAEVAWSGDRWSHSFALTCDEPTSIGPQQSLDEPERSFLWAGVTMTASAGWFAFDLEASGPAWVTIVRCDRPEILYLGAEEPQINAYLDVGRYLVSADAYADEHTSATVTARRLAEAPDLATVHGAPPPGFVSHLAQATGTTRGVRTAAPPGAAVNPRGAPAR
ncbi:MAG TPA: hypothetical protein VGB85_08890 [Nannocystis sp.]